jgi:uncharacterized membrane protein
MSANPRSTVRIAGHPLHPILVTIPIGLLIGALMTDVAYWQTGWASFAYFSAWLIGFGIIGALIAATAGFIDFIAEPRIRVLRKAWYHFIANLAVVALSVANFIVHMRDGAAAVLPAGLTLSAIVTVLLVFSGWMGGEMVFKAGVGVREDSTGRDT